MPPPHRLSGMGFLGCVVLGGLVGRGSPRSFTAVECGGYGTLGWGAGVFALFCLLTCIEPDKAGLKCVVFLYQAWRVNFVIAIVGGAKGRR